MAPLDTETIQVVRGSAARALRMVGGANAIGIPVVMIPLWVFVNGSSATKMAVSLAIVVFMGVVTLCACVAAATTIAAVRGRRLNFYFCGVRTRSVPLDASTAFELRTIGGRLEVLVIRSGGSSYVPNGALNSGDVAKLLRANGVAELKAG
jgi:hypothetical protein